MTGEQHADTVRRAVEAPHRAFATEGMEALDALLAEIQRLRDALEAAFWLIENLQNIRRGKVVRGLDEAIAGYESARAALRGGDAT